MATPSKSMTAGEFAKAAGIPAATISKLIQNGKLKAKREGNKWMVPSSQLESKTVRELGKARKPARPKKTARAAAATRPVKAPAPQVSAPAPRKEPVASAPGPRDVSPAGTPAPVEAPRPGAGSEEKTYSIAEFATLTYLTEKGVSEWLKIGRLQGVKTDSGDWRVLESNLEVSDISRLIRK